MTTRAHLRCGDDLRPRLEAAGIAGAYFCIADPVCQGPAQDNDGLLGWLGRRARFVALHARVPLAEAHARLAREYQALYGLGRFDEVWLWFEHDLWDQATLLRVLSILAPLQALRGKLFLMPADGRRVFPELGDSELAALRPAPLTDEQMEAAEFAWHAFTDEDPRLLDVLVRKPQPLPFLAAALRRHLMDLPWTTDGLALTERQLLHAVRVGAEDWRQAFAAMRPRDAVFHVTDLIVQDHIRRLREGPLRLLERNDPLRLTPRGLTVLEGRERHRPAPRFHAGAVVRPDPPWRWDPRRAGVKGGGE